MAETESDARAARAVILFADIVGCSKISDALSLREYGAFVKSFHETAELTLAAVFTRPQFSNPGSYEFSIRGDEVCVILHADPHDDVRRAIVFAVALQACWLTSKYNRDLLAKGSLPVSLGIGIHAGSVFIDRFQQPHPTAEGYAINIAKRIEGLTRDGTAVKRH